MATVTSLAGLNALSVVLQARPWSCRMILLLSIRNMTVCELLGIGDSNDSTTNPPNHLLHPCAILRNHCLLFGCCSTQLWRQHKPSSNTQETTTSAVPSEGCEIVVDTLSVITYTKRIMSYIAYTRRTRMSLFIEYTVVLLCVTLLVHYCL